MRKSQKAGWRFVLAMMATSGIPSSSSPKELAKVWTLEAANATADGRARISYGLPETDDTVIRFACAPESGVLEVLVFHTQRRMTRGSRTTALLRAGGILWSIRGQILANDESLDESFSGRIAFDAARFLRLTGADQLQISVGRGPAQSAPLTGFDEKFRQFSLICAKP
jgi:hypothetical protein